MGPSSGTLAELKQKRANERNQQQQQVRSSLPPTVQNSNLNAQKHAAAAEDSSRNSSSSTHFSVAGSGGGSSQQMQTAFNGSGQSYNQYNSSNVAAMPPANYSMQQPQSQKQNRISAPSAGGDSSYANSNNPPNQLSAAGKHSAMSSSTSNLSNR